jgi:hypothetical protein
VLRKGEGTENVSKLEIPVRYTFDKTQHLSADEWLDTLDFPDSADALELKDPMHESKSWLLLSGNFKWRSNGGDEDTEYPYRYLSLIVRSYLVRNQDKRKCWNWLRNENYRNVRMPEGYQMHGGFLGEYPWALPFARYFENSTDEQTETGIPCKLVPTSHYLNIHSEYDAYQPNAINVLLPAKRFYEHEDLRWDAAKTYTAVSGESRFVTLPVTGEGPLVLLGEEHYLTEFLNSHSLALVWAARTEKHYVDSFLSSHNLGYTEYARAHMIGNGKIKHSKALIERIRPRARSDKGQV